MNLTENEIKEIVDESGYVGKALSFRIRRKIYEVYKIKFSAMKTQWEQFNIKPPAFSTFVRDQLEEAVLASGLFKDDFNKYNNHHYEESTEKMVRSKNPEHNQQENAPPI
jgi:hypothetical protein